MVLTDEESNFWARYLESNPGAAAESRVSAGFAGGPDLTDELLALYLAGRKHAGSSARQDFSDITELPRVGDHWILLDGKRRPAAILRTEWIVTNAFFDVPPEVARAEGEGDLSLEHWRRAHAELWTPHLTRWGLKAVDEITVVTEFFTLVHQSSAGTSRSRQ